MARTKAYNTITDPYVLLAMEIVIGRLFIEKKIEVQDFGIFQLKTMRARKAFVPGSGKYKKFPAYTKMTFEPSLSFKQKLESWNPNQ